MINLLDYMWVLSGTKKSIELREGKMSTLMLKRRDPQRQVLRVPKAFESFS